MVRAFVKCTSVTLTFCVAGIAEGYRGVTQEEARPKLKADLKAAVAVAKKRASPIVLSKSCKNSVKNLEKVYGDCMAACMTADPPPAGSPVAEFNALSNAELAKKCSDKTLGKCLEDVAKEQAAFCKAGPCKGTQDTLTAMAKACDKPLCAKMKKKAAELKKKIKGIKDQGLVCCCLEALCFSIWGCSCEKVGAPKTKCTGKAKVVSAPCGEKPKDPMCKLKSFEAPCQAETDLEALLDDLKTYKCD